MNDLVCQRLHSNASANKNVSMADVSGIHGSNDQKEDRDGCIQR
jgi:hypothetical protein